MSDIAVEPIDVDPAPVDPAPEPAQSWAPSQDEWEQVTGALGYLAQLEQQRAQVYQPQSSQGQPTLPDPWERPDTFQQDLQAYIAAQVAPVQQFTNEAALSEAEERAMDILTDLASSGGEFDKDLARIRADHLLPQMQQRYGNGPKAAEAALEAAASEQRAYEQKMYEQAVSRHTNHLATLSGAPGEPGSTYVQGVTQRTMPDYRKGGSVTGKFFGRNADQ